MTQILFRNFQLLEPSNGELVGGHELLVEGGRVRELSATVIKSKDAAVIDCGGRTLMPGLIDCHVHVIHSEVNVRLMEAMPLTLLTARAATRLRAMLDRGFTTVRDTGGCDWGIKAGVEEGHLVGPRLFIAGQSIGPTGGHSDGRRRTDSIEGCTCCSGLAFKSAVADGTDAVRKAAREQMRQGADHVKIMMSGGVASPYDPLDSLQFSEEEVRAAVEEAHAFGRYVCAHAYSAVSITRAAKLGVRTIEHGNLIDDAAAKLMAENGMFLVANLVTYYAMKERAAK
ncbi:MAG: amidohydrolase family protein, partial [Hyphomicrobiaceae bacterium]|nr:amidohydrolase family protein [Hyphomicrobiaceae bacterium]